MFFKNDNKKFNLDKDSDISKPHSVYNFFSVKNSLIVIGILFFIIFIVFLILYINTNKKTDNVLKDTEIDVENKENKENSPSLLPGDLGSLNNNNSNQNYSEDIRAEYLTFGKFYKENNENIEVNISNYELPLNIKKDVINYYDISRKINLDSVTDKLNNNGFAIIDNPFNKENVDDFFSAYKALDNKNIPILITNDFLYYFQQNIIKDSYKKIQRDIFYNNVWDISKKLFNIADNRYQNNFAKSGIINDPLLESQRLEALYFGVLLNILEPLDSQINTKDNLGTNNNYYFSLLEASDYSINFPNYLREDIKKEVKLIREANSKKKSPALLYEVDYSKYIVPDDYKRSAKLNNFYLASLWANSLFPLYHKDVNCEECFLDSDDWLINFMSACLISKDFSENQEIKNQWAKIYKFISFFSGLKNDLTYLHYDEVLRELFGENYEINSIFSKDNKQKEKNINLIKTKLLEYKFLNLEGAFSRDEVREKPYIGMRMLQEPYWPNNYIFKKLTNPNVTYLENQKTTKLNNNNNITGCNFNNIYYRCRGFGLDVVNLIYPFMDDKAYFIENTRYKNYEKESNKLRKEISRFTLDNWHKNNFWSVLYVGKKLFETNDNEKFIYEKNNEWVDKNLNTVLGSWVNLQISSDEIATFQEDVNTGFQEYKNIYNEYNYIEPNKNVILELEANTNMILNMLDSLGMLTEAEDIYINLKDLKKDLNDFKTLIYKELEGKKLEAKEWQLIADLATKYSVVKKGEKDFYAYFKNNEEIERIHESIKGLKLLVLVYKYEDKNVIAVGPVFNYTESRF